MSNNDPKGFALIPERGPRRVLRFCTLNNPEHLSQLDVQRNILRISPIQYERLSESEQARLDITHYVTTKVIGEGSMTRFIDADAPDRVYPEPVTHCF